MGSEKDGEQPYQIGTYAFPGNIGGGVLNHAFMAINNQDDAGNDENKILGIKYPKLPKTRRKQAISQAKQQGNERLDPATTLLDLRLPEEFFNDFLHLLQRLGYGEPLSQKAVSHSGTRFYTHIHYNGFDRFLLYIPEWIITDPNPASSSAIAALSFAFAAESYLIVFHDSPTSPHIKIQQIIRKEWTMRYKGCELITHEQTQQLTCCNDAETQKFWLKEILGL